MNPPTNEPLESFQFKQRILDGMRRECKCHGLSGTCTMQTCWLKLPPFRDVAQKLHDSLDQAIKIIYEGLPPTNRLKSLTSAQLLASISSSSISTLPSPVSSASSLSPQKKSNKKRSSLSSTSSSSSSSSSTSTHTSSLKKRPVARSIGTSPTPIKPNPYDLLFYEESPDFCNPDENYNIKGTKGRICSETLNASNNCERLCCRRGHKTEIRVEKYKCECQFKYCCKLECKTCTRRKTIHKCS